jgi:hypothetical protein
VVLLSRIKVEVLPLIIGIAVLLRAAAAFMQGDRIEDLPGIYDQISYHTVAHRVLDGHGFTVPAGWWPATRAGEPTAHWSYLYTLYLTAVYGIFGDHPVVARLIQAVLAGIVQPLLTFRITNRLFGRRCAYVAAAVSASYLYFVYYSAALVTETFTILVLLWLFDLVLGRVCSISGSLEAQREQADTGSRRDYWFWPLLGLAIGAAALLRQATLVFAPFLIGWILIHWPPFSTRGSTSRPASARAVLPGIFLTMLVVAALILPATIRNYQAFGRFVLINTNAGYVLFWANHPIHGTDFIPILPNETYQKLIPRELRRLNEAALDSALLQRGVAFVTQDPLRYGYLSLYRIKEFFKFWPSPESGTASNIVRVASFGVLFPFLVAGIAIPLRRWSSYAVDQRSSVRLLYLFLFVYSTIHILSWALIRYRMPIDAILIVFASLPIVSVGRAASRLRARALITVGSKGI